MEIRRISLKGLIPIFGSIEFLSIEMSSTATGPLAIVRYADDGKKQPLGLRFDLDKGIFLDHFDDPVRENTLSSSASSIGSTVFAKVSNDK